jgi:nucleoside-diphosphate-sugar epimerase
MQVFVTGATGFIGSAVVKELIAAGHTVLGLCRSPEKAAALAAAGAEVLSGSIEDAEILKQGVARSDGVIHLAFNHDFSTFAANCEHDRRIIATLGAALSGSKRPLLVTSGTAIANTSPDQPATEDGATVGSQTNPRAASEEAAAALAASGINVSVVRLPQVHDTRRQGLITYVIDVYRDKGVCTYVGDGSIRWPAAHIEDVARLYRLAIERAEPGRAVPRGRGRRACRSTTSRRRSAGAWRCRWRRSRRRRPARTSAGSPCSRTMTWRPPARRRARS